MRKWLALAAIAVVALVIALMRELSETDATAAPAPQIAAVAAPVPAVTVPPPVARAVEKAVASEQKPKKIDMASDEFQNRLLEQVPAVVGSAAMRCYHGGLHRRSRDQLITIEFKEKVTNGEVTMSDVHAKESSLDDPELERCMLDKVAKAHWHDDELPDTPPIDDEVTITPERGGKKYTDENRNYVGAAAPANTPR